MLIAAIASLSLMGTTKSWAIGAGTILDLVNNVQSGEVNSNWNHGNRGAGHGAYGGYLCRAYDRGFEEHSRGHDSCFSCQRQHASCIERCESIEWVCRAQGGDGHGHLYFSRPGRGDTQGQAEREALRNCARERLFRCRVASCNRTQGQVITRRCGR